MRIYDLGEMQRHVARRAGRAVTESCACHEPKQARVRALEIAEQVTRRRRPLGENAAPHRPDETDPVVLTAGPGSKCRPFLTVHKNPEEFAACNALAEEIGPIDTPKKAYRIIEDAIGDEVNEVFGLMTLDLHNRFKSMATTGRGEPSSVMAPMVPTLQVALIDGAHSVVLWHVHPSGIEAEPSDADKETTEAFEEAFDTVGVILMDHVIIGGDIKKRSYYSFLEDGLLS
jgi:hypothetical protein